MDSEKGLRAEKVASPNPLKQFLDEQILPHLPESERDSLAPPDADMKFGKEMAQEEYDKFVKYNPSSDCGSSFSSSMLLPFWIVSYSDSSQSYAGMKELFIEKTKALAEILYRDAFFRNRYDSLDAWQSCSRYKEFQALLKNLNVLPEGAEERVASMSKELDELWSQPEVERAFEDEAADGLVESGMHEDSMLVQMYRKEDEPMTEERYESLREIRPDLVEDTYEKQLEWEEAHKHRYRLRL